VTYEEALVALSNAESWMKEAEQAGDRDEYRWAYEAKGRAEYALKRFKVGDL
jgi:hypothetical protein